MAERSEWTITTGESERSLSPGDKCAEVIRSAAAGEWGTVTARRGTGDKLTLRFNETFGFLEHWVSEDGPVSGARFPNRGPVADQPVELPCCGCGIPLRVPDGYVLRKSDAVRLLLQFIDGGELPRELMEAREFVQHILPGMEEFVLPAAVLNAVRWEPL